MEKININELEHMGGFIGIYYIYIQKRLDQTKNKYNAKNKHILVKCKDGTFTFLTTRSVVNLKNGHKSIKDALLSIKISNYKAKWFKTEELIDEWLKTNDI